MNPRTAAIVAVLALVVGAAGLVVGINAKNGNTSDEDISDSVKTELEQQLGTTASQEQSQEQAQATTEAGQTKSTDQQIADLTAEVSKLRTSVANLSTSQAASDKTINTLNNEIQKLNTRVANLESK